MNSLSHSPPAYQSLLFICYSEGKQCCLFKKINKLEKKKTSEERKRPIICYSNITRDQVLCQDVCKVLYKHDITLPSGEGRTWKMGTVMVLELRELRTRVNSAKITQLINRQGQDPNPSLSDSSSLPKPTTGSSARLRLKVTACLQRHKRRRVTLKHGTSLDDPRGCHTFRHSRNPV